MSAQNYIDIGPTPGEEPCEQLGKNYNPDKARAECIAYIHQIRRILGEEPKGAYLRIKREPGGNGGYLEVVCDYDRENDAARKYAYDSEACGDGYWDDAAKAELAAKGFEVTRHD